MHSLVGILCFHESFNCCYKNFLDFQRERKKGIVDVGKLGLSHIANGNGNYFNHFEQQIGNT